MTRSHRFLLAGCFTAAVAFAFSIAPAAADVVHMKDGKQLEGKIIENDPKKAEIKIRVQGIVQTLKRSDVLYALSPCKVTTGLKLRFTPRDPRKNRPSPSCMIEK